MIKVFWNKYKMAIVFTISCFLMGVILLLVTALNNSYQYKAIQVQKGETIWQLAELYADKTKMDKLTFVEWVENKNNLIGGDVHAGDSVIIPVKADHSKFDRTIQLAND